MTNLMHKYYGCQYRELYFLRFLDKRIYFLGRLGPETSWEDLESNYDHVLNVFGLMNLDSGHTSFIGLYRTTDLDELSQNFVGVDTVGYYEYDDDDDEKITFIDTIYFDTTFTFYGYTFDWDTTIYDMNILLQERSESMLIYY